MRTTIARTLVPPPDEQPACGCPTHTTPGSRYDAVTTVHVPKCPLYRAGDSTTRRYVPGTLDALLDEQFGPASRVVAERFGPVTR
jgi:hypothetical protein